MCDSPLEGTGFEPSVPLLRKVLLGVANRRRRHERRSHLQVQARDGNACLERHPIAFPFAEGPGFVDFLRTELDRVGPAHQICAVTSFLALWRSNSPFSKTPIRPEVLLRTLAPLTRNKRHLGNSRLQQIKRPRRRWPPLRDRWFESASLQRRVSDEPVPRRLGVALGRSPPGAPILPQFEIRVGRAARGKPRRSRDGARGLGRRGICGRSPRSTSGTGSRLTR